MVETDLERLMDELQQRQFGKFRGKVMDNRDPLKRGSIEVVVPTVLGESRVWALPCVPYAGPQVGLFAIPPLHSGVWIEFEGGRTDNPIWTGCFWAEGEVDAADADPGVFFFRTPVGMLRMSQAEGSIELAVEGGASIVLTATEVTVDGKSIKHTAGAAATALGAGGFDAMNGALKVI